MRIALAGASGLIGSALAPALESAGHTVRRLVRREASEPGEFSWDPESFGVPDEALDGAQAVVLAMPAQRLRENLDLFDFALSADEQAAVTALERGGRVSVHPDEVN